MRFLENWVFGDFQSLKPNPDEHRIQPIEASQLAHRVLVSNFDAALRVVRANLAISVVPREVAEPFAATGAVRVVPLADPWVQRRFAICYRSADALSPAARLLVESLAQAGGA